ncbi:MAG: sigma-70 family RNA polymerase sigma factor [Crenarchaeota archaeon]|nr:sigma-70 family RNA polymerase sigma factor [Thermoproteota archaeon]
MSIRIIETEGKQYNVKNLDLLPLFYLIPYEILLSKPNLLAIPRNAKLAVMNSHWRDVISSDEFLSVLFDCVSYYVWSAFGINPYIHCFSGYDPLFKLANDLNLWIDAYNDLYSSIKDILKYQFITVFIPFLSDEQAQDVFDRIGTRGIIKNNLQPIIDCVKANRCHEDYDARTSNPKRDFYRSWYHTRAKTKVVSLDAINENSNKTSKNSSKDHDDISNLVIDYSKTNFEHSAIYKMDLERYMALLNKKDAEIFTLKYDGYTQNEIAEKLGFKTHSAVSKRINNEIRDKYLEYFSWDANA